jgi:adenosylmethionine-8-amino-7-oxononanoate aminotransferase
MSNITKFIFGANTDVGKTLVSAGLCRALAAQGFPVHYIKPLQTGTEFDEEKVTQTVQSRCAASADLLETQTLFSWPDPISPHLAAAQTPVTNDDVRRALQNAVRSNEAKAVDNWTIIETAGGVLSPGPAQDCITTQADLFQICRYPVLMVGDATLGGISTTMAALESLIHRDYHIDAVIIIDEPNVDLGNGGAVAQLAGSVPVFRLPALPPKEVALDAWHDEAEPVFRGILDQLSSAPGNCLAQQQQQQQQQHEEEKETGLLPGLSTQDILDIDTSRLWHPYTSALQPLPCLGVVERAKGVRLQLEGGASIIDGMSSWWAAVHGYGVPELDAAAKEQIERMSHVMFGGLTHRPAVALGQHLCSMAPTRTDDKRSLTRCFLSDSGSVAVEVAIKMALQYWRARGFEGKTKLLTVRGGYHGDTFGAMGVCDPENGMHAEMFSGALQSHVFAPRPEPLFGEPCTDENIAEIEKLLQVSQHSARGGSNGSIGGSNIAAVILEPIVQGAGGMRFYSAEYLRRVRDLCDDYGTLLILDEIATGFGRTGKLFACEHAGIVPDIMCLGKALTGGYMTLGATLATEQVAFGVSGAELAGVGGDGEMEKCVPLMHGPTFMANPLACAVACASVELLMRSPWEERTRNIEHQLTRALMPLAASPAVADVRVLGAIGVLEMVDPVDVPSTTRLLANEYGVWLRPFGRLLYTMPPFVILPEDLGRITDGMAAVVTYAEDKFLFEA